MVDANKLQTKLIFNEKLQVDLYDKLYSTRLSLIKRKQELTGVSQKEAIKALNEAKQQSKADIHRLMSLIDFCIAIPFPLLIWLISQIIRIIKRKMK